MCMHVCVHVCVHPGTRGILYLEMATTDVQGKKRFLYFLACEAPWSTQTYTRTLFQLDNWCFVLVLRTSVPAAFAWDTHSRSINLSSKQEHHLPNLISGLCDTKPVIMHCSWEQLSTTQKPLLLLPLSLWILASYMCYMLKGHPPKQQQQQ